MDFECDGSWVQDDEQQWLQQVAKAADLCLKPWRHGVRFSGEPPRQGETWSDCALLLEARDEQGQRCAQQDLELEIYRSGDDLNLMLTRFNDDSRPLLWHGSHPVWMDANTGERCQRPNDGAPHEALCRRLRALLNPLDSDQN